MLGGIGFHWFLSGMHAEFKNNNTLALAVSCQFTLELLCCLKQPARHHTPDLGIFHLARFSAADFCLTAGPEYLPQLIDFFEKESGPIVGARVILSVCAQDGFLYFIDSVLYSNR